MKKIVVSMLLFLLIIKAQLVAQPAPESQSKVNRFEKLMELASERLSLTSEQESKVRTILTQAQVELKKANEAQANGNNLTAFGQKLKLLKETDEKIETVLSDDQRVKYEKIKAELKEQYDKKK